MRARVIVTLKTGILDPQGKAIEGALKSLGVDGVNSVRQGKIFDMEVDAATAAEGEAALRRAAEKLLANTVVENFHIEIDGASSPAPEPVEASDEDEFAPDEPVPAGAKED